MNEAQGNARSGQWIAVSLLLAVFLWGGNNTGVKYLVGSWPPIFIGGTRFLAAGLLLHAIVWWRQRGRAGLRLSAAENHRLWWGSGLTLAVYIIAFNWALRFTSASHVALYLGASPVWALLLEGRTAGARPPRARYGAAGLAFAGVAILFWPALTQVSSHWLGELLGLTCSVLWAWYGRQCRALGATLSGLAMTAHNMWRAGLWLVPLATLEAGWQGLVWGWDLFLIQGYCVVAGGVAAFLLWNDALRRWPTSRVYLFNNLIPLSTMTWAHFCLREPISPSFIVALTVILGAVLWSQTAREA